MPKRASHSLKLWFLLWTTWAFSLLLAILLIFSMGISDFHFSPPNPNIYYGVLLAVIFLNGSVLSAVAFPSLVGISMDSYSSLIVAGLIGFVQWFSICQLGRLWLRHWQSHKWYWRLLFPIFLAGYYAISGSISILLVTIIVG